jgi:chemosensory pili system protein ChpA (sensor histidine kinase/response regulator)
MNAHTALNPALKVLGAELAATLQRAQTDLRACLEDTQPTARLHALASGIDQVRGAFAMLDQPEAASLALETTTLARELARDQMKQTPAAQDTLLRAVLELPRYVDWLQRGNAQPATLVALTNESRAVRGLAPLTGSGPLPAPAADTAALVPLPQLAAQLRPRLQRALLNILRDQGVAEAAGQVTEIFVQLQAAGNAANRQFWRLAAELALALAQGRLPPNQNIKLLLRTLDGQLRNLSEHPVPPADDPLLQTLSQRLRSELTQAVTTPPPLPDDSPSAPSLPPMPALAGVASPPDAATLRQITDHLQQSLAISRETLEQFFGDISRLDCLPGVVDQLHAAANVLFMLNLDVPAGLLQHDLTRLQGWLTGTTAADAEQLVTLAGHLLLLEDSLAGVREFAHSDRWLSAASSELTVVEQVARLTEVTRQRATLQVSREAIRVMAQARELSVAALGEAAGRPVAWDGFQTLLHGVGGALALLNCQLAAVVVQRLENVVQVLTGGGVIQDSATILDAFAGVMVDLEYYLEQLGEGRGADDVILQRAATQLSQLEALLAEALGPSATVSLQAPAGGLPAAGQPLPAAAPPAITEALDAGALEQALHELDIASVVTPVPVAIVEPVPAVSEPLGVGTPPLPPPPAGPPVSPAAVPAIPAEAIDPELLEVFLEEAQGELASIREQLLIWRQQPDNHDPLLTIRRSFHTLKGSGRMVGQTVIGEFAWCYERLLNEVRDGKLTVSPALMDAVEAAQQALGPLVDERPPSGDEMAMLAVLTARAEALLSGTPAVAPPPVAPPREAPPVPPPLERPAVVEPELAVTRPTLVPVGVDPELVGIFQAEAAEILDASDLVLARWREQPAVELLNDLRREMHTLKGSSRMAGFMSIGDLAHALESVLDLMAARPLAEPGVLVETLQQALDQLSTMLTAVRDGNYPEPADVLIQQLQALVGKPATRWPPVSVPVAPTAPTPIPPAPPPVVSAPVVPAPPLPEIAGEAVTPPAAPLPAVPTAPVPEIAGEPVTAPAGPSAIRTELDQELVEAFQYEAAELLDTSELILQRWNAERDNMELLNNLRRSMHTLKGGSRMAGFAMIGDLAHAMESVLDGLGKATLTATTTVVETLQRALDGLNTMVAAVQAGTVPVAADELAGALRGLLGEAPRERTQPVFAPAKPAAPLPTRKAAGPAAAEDTIRVSTALLNKLVNEMGESSICRARIDQSLGALRFSLSELDQAVFRLRQQLRRLEIETETQILSRHERTDKQHQADFDPLELDRFSELQQLSRSLMEIVDDLNNIKGTLEDQSQDMGNVLDQQAKVNKEVQQGLMRTRMVRFSTVEPRLRRVVRQVAQELGKRAELVLTGADSEVDRTVLENMVAPLEHMLRNSISHGIESPEPRCAAGKAETGTIKLALRREGAELVLSLEDDGAGLNFPAIQAKGLAMGLLKPGQSVTEDELIALLMRPGFSTASKVTQIAGRGVGMDVLNAAIKAMRGALLIHSQPGQGTQFIIRLPFSLAVTQALLVQVGGDTYAVPLLSIESVTRLDEEKFRTYLTGTAVEHQYAGRRYPLHNLGVLFGVDTIKPYEETTDKRPPVLLFRSAEASAALQVDAVLGNQEIIVKPLAPQFQALTGFSGAAVLGDGRVVLVLELAALMRNLASQSQKQVESQALYAAREENRPERLRAMVIDDSITMRKATSRFLERHNISVTVAKDGMEAVAKLEQQVPDLVILDIEMPRMDGFEVAAHIRNQPHLRHVPIIMVTSRGGEKHRERAARLGVNGYLTKPYQEEDMLNSIRTVLGEGAQTLLL